MNTKATKKLFAMLAALWCTFTLTIPVFAADTSLMPEEAIITNCNLSISSAGQASCNVLVRTKTSSQRVEVVMSLYQIGRSEPLNSWSGKGTFMFSSTKTHHVTKGYDYQATATITIRDSSGNEIETIPISSTVIHY